MRKCFFFSLSVVLLVSFMVLSALNLQAKDIKKPPHPNIDLIAPIILEVIEIREAETEKGPMGHANYRIESSARFEVQMRQNPFTGRIGAACVCEIT